jgi:hypothetical protein
MNRKLAIIRYFAPANESRHRFDVTGLEAVPEFHCVPHPKDLTHPRFEWLAHPLPTAEFGIIYLILERTTQIRTKTTVPIGELLDAF